MEKTYCTLLAITLFATRGLVAHCGKCVEDSCPDCSTLIKNPGSEIKRTTPPTCTCKEGCSCKKMDCSLCKKTNCPCMSSEGKDTKHTEKPETIILGGGSQRNPGKTKHSFELPANPSTGYQWIIAEQKLPKGTTVTIGEVKYREPVIPGAQGIVSVEIMRGDVGEGTFRLEYVGPDKKVTEKRDYIVKIMPGNV